MKKTLAIIAFGVIIIGCGQMATTTKTTETTTSTTVPAAPEGSQGRFPDFGYMVPGYTVQDSVFKLSQDYPASLPKDLPGFMGVDFKKDWHKYLMDAQSYCFEGNMGEVDFRVEKNKIRKWYHMPWQHYGKLGREGFHGMTQEAPVAQFQLCPTQTIDTAVAVAVGFYNDIAAYTIGQTWKNHYRPDTNGASFKHGAVLFKLLFVTLPQNEAAKQVPYLDNGMWWDGYVVTNSHYMFRDDAPKYRWRTKVVLIQMDVMVRDTTSPNGWVFGNFQYNGKRNNPNKWLNLMPVGIMWGEDPQDTSSAYYNPTPSVTRINPNLKETIINPNTDELPVTHLGWNGRLNGPVDNPKSSCYSCHATAEYPQIAIMNPSFNSDFYSKNPMGSTGWMRWFRNEKCGQPFDSGAHSMDFSYQLAGSLQLFDQWFLEQGGLYDSSYHPAPGAPTPPPAPAANAPKMAMKMAMPAKKEVDPHASNATNPSHSASGRNVVPISFEAR